MFAGDIDVNLSAGDRDYELKVSEESAGQFEDMAHGTGAIVSAGACSTWPGRGAANIP